MVGAWAFRTRTWGRPGYTALEGSASYGNQTAEFFLVVGSAHVSLDEIPVNATWSFPPARREELLSALERLLWAGPTGASLSAGESTR